MQTESQAGVLVRGPGTSTSDSIPAALSDGELVIPADDVRRYGAAHLMRMVKQMGGQLPEPGMKDGVRHASGGGMITDPYGQPTNDVTRVGNSYSGGNVAGDIRVNGQVPGGTLSSYAAPGQAAPNPAPGVAALPAPAAAVPPIAAPATATPAVPVPAPLAAPAPARPAAMATGGQVSWTGRPQPAAGVDQILGALSQRAQVPKPAAPPPMQPSSGANQNFFSQGALGYAQGGLVDERDLRRPLSANAAPPAAPPPDGPEGGGAVLGFFPQLGRNQFRPNTMDAQLRRGWQSTAPGEFAPAQPLSQSALPPAPSRLNSTTDPRSTLYVPPETAAPAVPTPLSAAAAPMPTIPGANSSVPPVDSLPAGVTRDGSSFSGTNVAAPPGSSAGDSSRAGPLGSMADTLAQLKNLQASNASTPQGGLTVIDNPGPAAAQSMFDSAALRTAAARGSWSPRKGFQADDGAIAAAALPLAQRAQQEALQTREQGATQRSTFEQKGLAARAQLADTRQAEANSIDRSKLGIDLIRATQSGLPAGYRAKADGTGLEPIPGGPADPNTPKGKNALTEDQAKSAGYAVRMENALKLIGGVGATNPGATRPGLGTALVNVLPESLANKVRPEDRQRVEAAQLDALDAALTLNTGAAYTKEQLQGLSRAYFAQPGDADKTVAEKQQRLNSLIDTARLRAGSAGSTLADTAVQKATTANGQGAQAPAAVPAGMSKQVGTSGGKPVYEDAQGRRFIGG